MATFSKLHYYMYIVQLKTTFKKKGNSTIADFALLKKAVYLSKTSESIACVCVRVRERERGGERKRKRGRERLVGE